MFLTLRTPPEHRSPTGGEATLPNGAAISSEATGQQRQSRCPKHGRCKATITRPPRAKQSLAEGSTLAPLLSYEPSATALGLPPKAGERTKLADGSRPLPRSPDTWKLMDVWDKPKQHFHCPKCISSTSPKWIREAQKPSNF